MEIQPDIARLGSEAQPEECSTVSVTAGTVTVQPLPLSLSDEGPPAKVAAHIHGCQCVLILPNESLVGSNKDLFT